MIVASAIMYKGIVFTGCRHNDIIHYLIKLGYQRPIPNNEQGFIDHMGYFLTREESLEHCIVVEQIKLKENKQPDIIGSVLTSEDLW